MVIKDQTFTIKPSHLRTLKEKWATLYSKEMEILWKTTPSKANEDRKDRLKAQKDQRVRRRREGLS
jgi:hypothetical protein